MTTLNLADLYETVSSTVPERTALVYGADRLTYADLDRRANRIARHLLGVGLQTGEHVGLHLGNGTAHVEALLGCLKARLVPININYRYTAHELAYLYTDAQLSGLIVDAEYAAAASEVAGQTKLRHVTVVGASTVDWPMPASEYPSDGPDGPLPDARSPEDRFVLYTGGTTGNPKGVVWRQEDFFFSALAGGNPYGAPRTSPAEVAAAAAQTPPMTYLLAAPLMHGAAAYNLFMAFCMGSTVVLDRRFDADRALQLIQDERVMIVTVVGDAMARPLADAVAAHGAGHDLSSWQVLGSGGALLSRSVRDQFQKLLPDLLIRDGFGASESGMDGRLEVGVDGLPRLAAGSNVRVLDDLLRPVEPGQTGRIAKSGHVPLGYFNDPEKSAATFPVVDGTRWVVLGDLARLEQDGSMVLLGRGSQCINTGGEKVFPEEVEQALKAHPAVLDALVSGVPDERFGQRVAAAVELRPGATVDIDELRIHCRAQLAGYKVPAKIVMVPQVVRSPTGKADYRWARDVLTAH